MARSTIVGVAPALALAAVLGCSPDFDPPSKIKALRVLAVQKDEPYAKPGDTVKMSMLFADASDEAPRPLHIAWLPGRQDPLGDSYLASFLPTADKCNPDAPALGAGSGGLPSLGTAGTPIPAELERGPEFSLPLKPDIISCRPKPQDPRQTPYGTQFVFFVACAGDHLGFTGGDPTSFPIGCYDKNGVPLGSDDFVAGYTEIFAYDAVTNQNPAATGFKVDGKPVTLDCIGHDCITLEKAELARGLASRDGGAPLVFSDSGAGALQGADASAGDAGAADAGLGGDAGEAARPQESLDQPIDCSRADPRCIDVCTASKQENCPKHSIDIVVDQQTSPEHNVALERQEGGTIFEQMWINYYADQGKVLHDVKLLSDATLGWAPQHSAEIFAPMEPGPFHVWAVAHDNRGGAEWVRIRLMAR